MKRYSRELQRDGPPVSPNFEDVYPIMRRVASARAAEVATTCGLSADERSDLEQEAALQVWRKLGVFDATRSSLKTFIERIVANQMASSIRRLRAEKRKSLPGECTLTHVDGDVDSVNLRIDVLRVLDGLRPDQRDVCRMLADHSVADVGRRAGISRATVYRMIGHLRVAFTEAGLHQSPRARTGHESTAPRFLPLELAVVWNGRGTISKTTGPNGDRRDVHAPDFGASARGSLAAKRWSSSRSEVRRRGNERSI